MSHVAEFRELIQPSIPQIVTLLSDNESDVRTAGANALSYLAGQGRISIFLVRMPLMSIVAEFRESIGLAIPQIIALLEHNDSYVRTASANALSKLSEQGRISRCLF